MKTTVNLKDLIEAALRAVLAQRWKPTHVLRDASVGGQGPQIEFRDANWERLREAIKRPSS